MEGRRHDRLQGDGELPAGPMVVSGELPEGAAGVSEHTVGELDRWEDIQRGAGANALHVLGKGGVPRPPVGNQRNEMFTILKSLWSPSDPGRTAVPLDMPVKIPRPLLRSKSPRRWGRSRPAANRSRPAPSRSTYGTRRWWFRCGDLPAVGEAVGTRTERWRLAASGRRQGRWTRGLALK